MGNLEMQTITEETAIAQCSSSPRREEFGTYSGVQENIDYSTFSVRILSTKIIFEAETGLQLDYNPKKYNFYRNIVDNEEMDLIKEWERKRRQLIFLQDLLSLSVALDFNFEVIGPIKYTNIGRLVNLGKDKPNREAILHIAKMVSRTAQDLPYYRNADVICSVPPSPQKTYDLPSEVTSVVSWNLGKQDVTTGFTLKEEKESIKNFPFEKKWGVWEKAQVSFKNELQCNVYGKKVILIDDLYQSGITIQYIAMKLQQAGAREVYGLCFAKTLRNSDNT